MEEQDDRATPKHPWGIGGPKTAEHKALAKQWFLEELPRCHTVSSACDYAGINRATAYTWKDQDKKFAEAWDIAVERIHDKARAKIFERAFEGIDSYVVSNGKLVYIEAGVDEQGKENFAPIIEKKYSDSLAALYARANLPEYKDKQTIDLNVKMAEEAEKAKESLLASLGAVLDENSKAAPQG